LYRFVVSRGLGSLLREMSRPLRSTQDLESFWHGALHCDAPCVEDLGLFGCHESSYYPDVEHSGHCSRCKITRLSDFDALHEHWASGGAKGYARYATAYPVKSTSGSIYTISYCIYVAFRRLCTDAAHAARELQFSKVQKSGTAPYTMRPTWQGNSNSPKSKRPIPLHIRPFKSYSNLSIPLRNTVHRLLT
jgi:hypothetical protein